MSVKTKLAIFHVIHVQAVYQKIILCFLLLLEINIKIKYTKYVVQEFTGSTLFKRWGSGEPEVKQGEIRVNRLKHCSFTVSERRRHSKGVQEK